MKQQNIQVAAPGFMGVNTEGAPTSLDTGWCAIADNAVIDKSGRIGTRKGYRVLTSDNTDLGTAYINEIHEARYFNGDVKKFAVGNNKIFSFDDAGVLTDITPGGATITADEWQITTLRDDTFFFQLGHAPIVWDNSAATCTLVSAHVNYSGTVPEADCAHAAYGRLWAGNTSGDISTLYWSDLLIGAAWTGGTTGSLDLTYLWPNGNDEIRAIASHNAKLIVFGAQSTLVFGSSSADGRLGNPNTDIFQEDDIGEIGCIGKYAYTVVGDDLWFIDYSGIRSLGRTIQEKSVPIGDISANVRSQFKTEIKLEVNKPRLIYDPENAFVLCVLQGLPHIFCFDSRGHLEDGSSRTTMWTGMDFACVGRSVTGDLWFGNNDGINKYQGFIDAASALGVGGTPYRFRYYTHPQTFGAPANLKMPKEVDFTISGGVGQPATCYWGFDYKYLFKRQAFTLNSDTPDFYNIDEFNITTSDDPLDPTEYGSGSAIGRYAISLSGSGCSVIIGLEADVSGGQVSIQEMNLQTTMGRMV